jgi:putative FmdB family regulatory protein
MKRAVASSRFIPHHTKQPEKEDMPLYEYECTACHERTEKIQKFSDPEITICPHCSGHLERVLSAPAISFKGGGWYADGYGNAKPKSTGDSSASTDSSATVKTGAEKTSTDSKSNKDSTPAAATATAPAAPATSSSTSSTDKK